MSKLLNFEEFSAETKRMDKVREEYINILYNFKTEFTLDLSEDEWILLSRFTRDHLQHALAANDSNQTMAIMSYLLLAYFTENKIWPRSLIDLQTTNIQYIFVEFILFISITSYKQIRGQMLKKMQEKIQRYWENLKQELEEKLKGGTK